MTRPRAVTFCVMDPTTDLVAALRYHALLCFDHCASNMACKEPTLCFMSVLLVTCDLPAATRCIGQVDDPARRTVC